MSHSGTIRSHLPANPFALRRSGAARLAFTENMDAWVRGIEGKPNPDFRTMAARQAFQRVVADNSELLDPWDEGHDAEQEWRKSVHPLRAAVKVSTAR